VRELAVTKAWRLGGVSQEIDEVVRTLCGIVRDGALIASITGMDRCPANTIADLHGSSGVVGRDVLPKLLDRGYPFVAKADRTGKRQLTPPEVEISSANAG
jgi:hypothetical protein